MIKQAICCNTRLPAQHIYKVICELIKLTFVPEQHRIGDSNLPESKSHIYTVSNKHPIME